MLSWKRRMGGCGVRVHEFKWEALLEARLGRERSTWASARWPVSASACVASKCGVRSPGKKPKRPLSHPGGAGEEKTGGKQRCFPAAGRHPAAWG